VKKVLTAIVVPEVMMRMSVKGLEVALLFFDLLNAAATVGESGERGEGAVRVITAGALGSNAAS
jgi:hypothetical protein